MASLSLSRFFFFFFSSLSLSPFDQALAVLKKFYAKVALTQVPHLHEDEASLK